MKASLTLCPWETLFDLQGFQLGLVEVEAEDDLVSTSLFPTAVWIEKIRPRMGLLLSGVTGRKFTPVLFSLLGLIAPWGMGIQGEKG